MQGEGILAVHKRGKKIERREREREKERRGMEKNVEGER